MLMTQTEYQTIKDFYKNKKVLITGHTGFKGSWLAFWLHSLGAEIYGYSLPYDEKLNVLYNVANIHTKCKKECFSDIREYRDIKKFFNEVEPEIVFHLAAQPIVSEGYKNPRDTFEINLMGTVNVLECIRKCPSVKSIVIITTDKVYDENYFDNTTGYKEFDPLNGRDPYSNSKSCADIATQCYTNCFLENPVTIFRAGNVIGGGDFAPNRIVPDCMRAWYNGEIPQLRNPFSIRPYQHVLEPIYAYIYFGMIQTYDRISDIINIGPNPKDCLTTEDLVIKMADALGEEKTYITGPRPVMLESNALKLDCSHLESLGWMPRLTIDETIQMTVSWYQQYYTGGSIESLMENQIKFYIGE